MSIFSNMVSSTFFHRNLNKIDLFPFIALFISKFTGFRIFFGNFCAFFTFLGRRFYNFLLSNLEHFSSLQVLKSSMMPIFSWKSALHSLMSRFKFRWFCHLSIFFATFTFSQRIFDEYVHFLHLVRHSISFFRRFVNVSFWADEILIKTVGSFFIILNFFHRNPSEIQIYSN